MDRLQKKLKQDYKYDFRLRYILKEYSIQEIVSHIMGWLTIGTKEAKSLNYVEITNIAKDFYIGSDLTEEEKTGYYSELVQQNFFKILDTFLYAKELGVCSWTIYIFGKFSESENSKYLEIAYEKIYSVTNPILASRCLNELNWLGSSNIEEYLNKLYETKSLISKLTLLMCWECYRENQEINKIFEDKELISFISPRNENISKDIIYEKQTNLENYIFSIHNEYKELQINQDEFSKIAREFFENASYIPD